MGSHGHHSHHGGDVDWHAAADALEVDGTLALPLVREVVGWLVTNGLDPSRTGHVIDAGCGPGVVTCELARLFPVAAVSGLDSTAPLLERLRRRAEANGLDGRVTAVQADLEGTLPPLEPADLAWVAMVAHHVGDRLAVLGRLRDRLRPGGVLVLVEFAGHVRVLPDDDPLVAGGAWDGLESAAMASLLRRLGFDAVGHDWPADLAETGFTDVTDRVRTFRRDAPLDPMGRSWLVRHVRRGLRMAEGTVDAGHVAMLEAFADAVESGARIDPFVLAERRVLTARREPRAARSILP